MLSKKDSFFKTVRFSFVMRYFGLFITLLTILFFVIFQFASAHINKKTDEKIIETLNDLDWIYLHRGKSYLHEQVYKNIKFLALSRGVENVFFVYYENNKIKYASELSQWPNIDSVLFKSLSLNTISENTNSYQLKRFELEVKIKQLKYQGKDNALKIGFFKVVEGEYFVIGQSLDEDNEFRNQLRLILLTSFSIILFIGFVLVYILINKVMKTIESVTNTAIKIENGDLTQRVKVLSNKREISNLVVSFNDMLERINLLLNEIKGVSNDIAHDLRSPITSIRLLSETALTGSTSIQENKLIFEKIILKSDYLISMINTLLEIVEIESNANDSLFEPIEMKDVLTIAYDLYVTSAEEKKIRFVLELDKSLIYIYGNRSLIQRAISNIVDNAIKYNRENGQITISTFSNNNMIEIEIRDTGIGLTKEEIDKIFNKFYRADKSRTNEGNGLGLSFAYTVISKHNGTLNVDSELNKWTCFKIKIPEYINPSSTL